MANGKNYFSFSELVTTDTGLPNNPTSPSHLVNLANLWGYLNSLREELGKPIFINSAFRTPSVNKQVKGSKRSFHMRGLAADIRTEPDYMYALRSLLQRDYELHYLTEYIDYESFFHIAL